jgi:hypothetical protein
MHASLVILVILPAVVAPATASRAGEKPFPLRAKKRRFHLRTAVFAFGPFLRRPAFAGFCCRKILPDDLDCALAGPAQSFIAYSFTPVTAPTFHKSHRQIL